MKHCSLMLLALTFAGSLFTVSGLSEADSLVRIFTAQKSDHEMPGNALAKVQRMIDRLKQKIRNETELNTNMNVHYVKWCAKSKLTAEQEMKYHRDIADKQYAILLETSADVKEAQEEIDRLFEELVVTQTQLKRATELREHEAAQYKQNKQDLEDSLEAINKAITILSAEIAKNPAFLQKLDTRTVGSLLHTFSVAMDAVSIPRNDKQRLYAFIQNQQLNKQMQEEDQQDDDTGKQPDLEKAAYTARSGEIVDTLEDMKHDAIIMLRKMEDEEIEAMGIYLKLRQSLEAEIKEEQAALDEHKKVKAAALIAHAEAEKIYNKAKFDMDHNIQILKDLEKDCAQQEDDYQRFLIEQQKEIDMLDKARAFLDDAMTHVGGPQDMTESGDFTVDVNLKHETIHNYNYSAEETFFLQEREGTVHVNRLSSEIHGIIMNLANKNHNVALAQLASRIKSVLRYASRSREDPFKKVKDLIKDMIIKLEDEIANQEKEMAYCDREMNETKAKLTELGVSIEKLDRIHEMSYFKEIDLAEWMAEVRKAIADEAQARADAEELFEEQSRDYYNTMQELKDGLAAVQQAIALLSEFYGAPPEEEVSGDDMNASLTENTDVQHDETMHAVESAEGSAFPQERATGKDKAKEKKRKFMQGHGIIEMLQIIERDLLESIRLQQEMLDKLGIRHHEVMHDYITNRELNEKDLEYAEKDKTIQHRETGQAEEDEDIKLTEKEQLSVYYLNLRDRCITRPEDQRDRTEARAREIAGLKEALHVLYTETQWLQEDSKSYLRGGKGRLRRQYT